MTSTSTWAASPWAAWAAWTATRACFSRTARLGAALFLFQRTRQLPSLPRLTRACSWGRTQRACCQIGEAQSPSEPAPCYYYCPCCWSHGCDAIPDVVVVVVGNGVFGLLAAVWPPWHRHHGILCQTLCALFPPRRRIPPRSRRFERTPSVLNKIGPWR